MTHHIAVKAAPATTGNGLRGSDSSGKKIPHAHTEKVSQQQAVRWRDVLPVHPAAEIFPLMGEAELRELADDIAKHGSETRIDLYHDMKADKFSLVDGRNRLDALEMTGAKIFDDKGKVQERFVGKILTSLGGNRDIVAYVVSKNIRRRHLSLEQRRELLVKLINDDPKKSDRQLAKATGQSRNTISAQRKRLESTGSIEPVEKPLGQNALKRKLIGQLLKKHPDWSNRRIAQETAKYISIRFPDDGNEPQRRSHVR